MERYVIIGNGVAAAACIEGIRSTDKNGSITVISKEPYAVYCRPLISYYLEGKTDTEKMAYRDADFYEKAKAEVKFGTEAVSIDKEAQIVSLSDGTAIPYTKLCLATGSSPFVPPFRGLETVEKKVTFLTLDDALSIESAITPDTRVLIVGGGLIGLKCAEGLKNRVAEITVCDLADRVLSSILDKESAQVVESHLSANGITLMMGDSVTEFDGGIAHMQSGKTVEFDLLVLAVGVRANTALATEVGAKIGRGIVADTHMATTESRIFAAGDCAEGYDVTIDGNRVLALLPNAYRQGYCAGVNMAGGDCVFDKGIPMNAMGIFGLHMMTAGTYPSAEDGGQVYTEQDEAGLKKLFVKDGFLTGFILLGKTERAGIYTAMIRDKTPIDSVNFELLKKTPTTVAFSAENRRKMFGGVV